VFSPVREWYAFFAVLAMRKHRDFTPEAVTMDASGDLSHKSSSSFLIFSFVCSFVSDGKYSEKKSCGFTSRASAILINVRTVGCFMPLSMFPMKLCDRLERKDSSIWEIPFWARIDFILSITYRNCSLASIDKK